MRGAAGRGPWATASAGAGVQRLGLEVVATLLTAAGVLLLVTVVPERLDVGAAYPVFGAAAVLVAFCNPRVDLSLIGLAFYLGCIDGPLKLYTGSSDVTLLRDVLLYAILAGVLLRSTVAHRRLPRVPYAGLVLAFAAAVALQAVNPGTPGAPGILAGWRQQFGFVPLLVLATLVADREHLLRTVGLVLLAVTVPNVVAAVIQSRLTPEQFASWGPGYADRVLGRGSFAGSARTFEDGTTTHVRPFGLGSDSGAAGVFAWVAAAFALAFASRGGWRPRLLFGGVGFVFCAIGVLTSQSRGAALAAIVVVLAYFAVQARSRNAVATVLAVSATVLVVYAIATSFAASSGPGAVTRLSTLAPGSAASTIARDRGSSIEIVPDYAVDYPLGVGLGRAGPSSGSVGDPSGLNAENELTFLIGEIGLPGLITFALLWLAVLRDAVRIARREEDPERRALWCAVAAVLVGTTVVWFQASPSTQPPTGPLFWFLAGVVGTAVLRARGAAVPVDGRRHRVAPPRHGSGAASG